MKHLLITLLLLTLCSPALAQIPSSKSAVGMVDVKVLNPALKDAQQTHSWDPILWGSLHKANDKELYMDVSLESGLYTRTLAKSKGGIKDSATAFATIKVRVAVYPGVYQTIEEINALPADAADWYAAPGGTAGVTFNAREQTLSATFQGLLDGCVDAEGHLDLSNSCLAPEEVELVLNTMSANSFNFLVANLPSGDYTVVVQAEINTSDNAEQTESRATLGHGSMVVDEIRLIKDVNGQLPTPE